MYVLLLARDLMILFIAFCCFSCINSSHFDNELWYKFAKEYIQYDILIMDNKVESAEEGFKLLQDRNTIVQSLLNSRPPEHTELKKLLASQNIFEKKIALVNIMLRRIMDLDLSKNIINILSSSEDLAIKLYAYQCLNTLERDKVNMYKDEILDVITNENKDGLIIAAIPILVKIDSEQIVTLFKRYLTDGSLSVKQVAHINLPKMDEKYQNKIKNYLNKLDISH